MWLSRFPPAPGSWPYLVPGSRAPASARGGEGVAAAAPVPPSCCDCRNPGGRGEQEGTVITISSSHSSEFPHLESLLLPPACTPPEATAAVRYPKCSPHPLPVAQEGASPKWECPSVSPQVTQSPKARPPASPVSLATVASCCSHRKCCQFGELGPSLRALASSTPSLLERGEE